MNACVLRESMSVRKYPLSTYASDGGGVVEMPLKCLGTNVNWGEGGLEIEIFCART